MSLARALARHGLGLREAHDVLNRLADGQEVPVALPSTLDLDGVRADLAGLGVEMRPRRVPVAVDEVLA